MKRRRALPTFLVIGAQKAGTSTLARLLVRHPDVAMPSRKELHFFGRGRYRKGLDWYARQFGRYRDVPARFEATPGYMFFADACAAIARDLPDETRFVAIVRDPVDRAYSQYWHARRLGAISTSFEEALEREPAEVAAGRDVWSSLVGRGLYARQLDRFAAAAGRDRMLVIGFDDLLADPGATADAVADFVGVARLGADWGPLPHSNPARRVLVPIPHLAYRAMPYRIRVGVNWLLTVPFTPPPMRPETRAALAARFRDENDALAARWRVDVSSWTR